MEDNDCKVTINEAYRSMVYFLEDYYELTKSDEIGGMLGGLALLSDGRPADDACWEDWLKAVKRAQNDSESVKLKILNDLE